MPSSAEPNGPASGLPAPMEINALTTDEIQRMVLIEQLSNFTEQKKVFAMQQELLQAQLEIAQMKKRKLAAELSSLSANHR